MFILTILAKNSSEFHPILTTKISIIRLLLTAILAMLPSLNHQFAF